MYEDVSDDAAELINDTVVIPDEVMNEPVEETTTSSIAAPDVTVETAAPAHSIGPAGDLDTEPAVADPSGESSESSSDLDLDFLDDMSSSANAPQTDLALKLIICALFAATMFLSGKSGRKDED